MDERSATCMCVCVCIHQLQRLTNTFTYLTGTILPPYLPYLSPVGNFPFGTRISPQCTRSTVREKMFLQRAKTLKNGCLSRIDLKNLQWYLYLALDFVWCYVIEKSWFHFRKDKRFLFFLPRMPSVLWGHPASSSQGTRVFFCTSMRLAVHLDLVPRLRTNSVVIPLACMHLCLA